LPLASSPSKSGARISKTLWVNDIAPHRTRAGARDIVDEYKIKDGLALNGLQAGDPVKAANCGGLFRWGRRGTEAPRPLFLSPIPGGPTLGGLYENNSNQPVLPRITSGSDR
jgi:hypothetical protein